MKIIVLGAGKVGKTLIKHMSNEDHDIIVVDQNATKVEEVVNQYDVIGVVGNGGSYDILMKAGAEDANLIICVTTSDELNILAGLMAKKMGKTRIIAETGAGQHGVATATAAALLGLECEIFMGKEDTDRQALNVYRMELLGAKVHPVTTGTMTLKDAVNEIGRAHV